MNSNEAGSWFPLFVYRGACRDDYSRQQRPDGGENILTHQTCGITHYWCRKYQPVLAASVPWFTTMSGTAYSGLLRQWGVCVSPAGWIALPRLSGSQAL